MKDSSSNPSSFDLNSDGAAARGLTGVLRRFLCGSLRGRACGVSEEVETVVHGRERKDEQKKPTSPGIVARLMGLESMPVFPNAPPDSIGRSRSTNSVHGWPVLSPQRSRRQQIEASLSFREVPTFLSQENEDFLLLSFTPDDREEILVSATSEVKPKLGGFGELEGKKSEDTSKAKKERKTERRVGEKKVKRRKQRQDFCRDYVSQRNHSEIKDSTTPRKNHAYKKPRSGMNAEKSVKPRKHKEMLERANYAEKKSGYGHKVELECSSQNSSPVSVLDHILDMDGEDVVSPNSPTSEEDKKPKQLNSRRKLSPDFENRSSPRIHLISISREGGLRSLAEERSKKTRNIEAQLDLSEKWGQICKLVKEDVKKSNWNPKGMWKLEDSGEFAVVCGLEILDFLLQEAVAEFSDYPRA